jgi:diguanylate cyclase (GGDEF)-like protein
LRLNVLTLRLEQPITERMTIETAPPERPLVLVAEDDPDIRGLIAHRLRGAGCDVVTAHDGISALALARSAEPDLLLLDVTMPGLDGFAVCREVQNQGPLAPVVIFLTAHGNTFSRVTGLEAGAVDYVVKPFEGAELLARVRAALRTKALQDQLAAEAATDPLTGLLNRRQLDLRLAETVALAHRHGRPVSALLIDLDHFKRVNDCYGHLAGDQVLRDVSARVRGTCRISDLIARYGGEEFVVVLPETDSAGAVAAAEKIRWAISARPIVFETGGRLRVSASIGAAQLQPESGTPEQLIAAADSALYDAKERGRDQVATASA